MHSSLLLGVDLGSGGCKVTILRTDGTIVGSASREYSTFYPKPAWAEQNPEDWYQTVRTTLREAVSKSQVNPKDIVSVCIDGVPHIVVLSDSKGNVVRPAILWSDQRSAPQSEWLEKEFGEEIFKVGYQRVAPSWTLPQLLWVKQNEPEAWRRVEKIFTMKDYVRFRLTGVWVTDPIDAIGTLLMDVKNGTWSKKLCDMIGLSEDKLPPIAMPTNIVGKITNAASSEVGILEGAPVITGAPDTAMELLGAGAIKPGQVVVKLATAGVVFSITDNPHPHPQILTYYHAVPKLWYSFAGTSSCGSSLRWFRDVFCREEIETSKRSNVDAYELIDIEAAKVPKGSNGLLFHPYLMGERSPYWDSYLKANFVGIRMGHKKEHFARAVLEGVAFSLRDCQLLMQDLKLLNSEEKEVTLIGGGSKSQLWTRIVCDVLGVEVKKMAVAEASFGAAMLAGIGIGVYKDAEEAVQKCVRVEARVRPNVVSHEFYSERFELYKRVHDNLAEINRLL